MEQINQIRLDKFIKQYWSHSILHYLWSADLPRSFSQLIMSIFIFLSGCPTLLISWFINFKLILCLATCGPNEDVRCVFLLLKRARYRKRKQVQVIENVNKLRQQNCMFKDFFWKTRQDTRCIVFFSKKF